MELSSRKKDLLFILGGLAIGAGLGLFLFFALGIGGGRSRVDGLTPGRALSGSPAVGNPAPDFELENLAGEVVRLSELQGKAVLINFWATWCGPCRLEMPAIQDRYTQYEPSLAVLAVNFDEPVQLVQDFVDELGLSFPVLLDPGGEVQDLFRVRGYPTTYFVDAEGVVRVVHIGIMTEEQLDDYLVQVGVIE